MNDGLVAMDFADVRQSFESDDLELNQIRKKTKHTAVQRSEVERPLSRGTAAVNPPTSHGTVVAGADSHNPFASPKKPPTTEPNGPFVLTDSEDEQV